MNQARGLAYSWVMPVEHVPYDPGWPAQFEAARAELLPLVSPEGTIEHIGSTSIPGCAAQPIIDILVQLPTLPLDWEPMIDLGYEELLGDGGVNQVFYREAPRNKVHVTQTGSKYAHDRLLFRDFLRQHLERSQQYEQLKAEQAAAHPDSEGAYTAGKTAFVAETLALSEAAGASAEPDIPASRAVAHESETPLL